MRGKRERAQRFGEWLHPTLNNLGMSAKTLAAELGVAEGTVSRWRSGIGTPSSPEVIDRMADLFELDHLRLAVTAGMISPESAGVPPYPPPVDTTLHEDARRSIDKIKGLSEDGKRRLLELAEQLLEETE